MKTPTMNDTVARLQREAEDAAGLEPQGFWTDPEFLNRNKECPNRDCQGTGFLRKVPGPNELPCPDCRPQAAKGGKR